MYTPPPTIVFSSIYNNDTRGVDFFVRIQKNKL